MVELVWILTNCGLGYFFSTSSPAIIVVFCLYSILTAVKWNLIVIFICFSLKPREHECLFTWLLGPLNLKLLFVPFLHFLKGLFVLLLSFWILYKSWILVHYLFIACKYSLRICGLCPHCTDRSLAVKKLQLRMWTKYVWLREPEIEEEDINHVCAWLESCSGCESQGEKQCLEENKKISQSLNFFWDNMCDYYFWFFWKTFGMKGCMFFQWYTWIE